MAERVFYLLAYDIANPKRLAKVARVMEAWGERVQDSVFEAWLEASELEKLLKKVQKVFNEQEDSVRIYQLCATCKGKVRCLGQGTVTPAPGLVIV
jgi:CRISPR-associated protein Cas2